MWQGELFFKDRTSQYIVSDLSNHNLPSDIAGELFKSSEEAESLLASI